MNNNFSRGSEWRRWDLHIHTPDTNKNNQFSGSNSEEKWKKFYEDINNYIGNGGDSLKNIAVIGITDYLSIENYNRVISENKLPDSVELVLPNVEMRILPIANDSPVNIHFIFNPKIVDQLESRFFSKLKYQYGSTSFSANKLELIRFGKEINNALDENSAYIKGVEQFVPPFNVVLEVFNEDPDLRENVIIGVSNNTNDGASGVSCHHSYLTNNGSQLTAARQAIYKFADVIFSANQGDINYFLGKKENCPIEDVIKKCGSLKPCIHGSDTHCNAKIFEPDNRRYCWIKADPTFNGLKQIKYEPEERVRISELMPETKNNYFVIDRMEINDANFQTKPIYFNDKLTCIIGGKSTGKSILIQNLAMAINSDEVSEYLEKSKNKTLEVENVNVFWRDGTNEKRKIVYIPQTYLNKLSDEEQEKTEIDIWIQNIILNKTEVKTAQNILLANLKKYKNELGKNIIDLLSKHKEQENLKAEIANLGTKDGIEKEIEKLESEKSKLSNELNFSENELKNYDELLIKVEQLRQRQEELLHTKSKIVGVETIANPEFLDFNISNKYTEIVIQKQKEALDAVNRQWLELKNNIISEIDTELKNTINNISNCEQDVKILEEKVKQNDAILQLTKKIQQERNNLTNFLKKKEVLKVAKEYFDNQLSSIINLVDLYKKERIIFMDVVNQHRIMDGELVFYAEVPFRRDAFLEKMLAIFNNRSVAFKNIIDENNFKESDYNKEKIIQLLHLALNQPSTLKGGYSTESAFKEILNDWYNIVYRVIMDGDSIDKMSPGKKALVLLKILISLAETNCPILIDQPEDDLDNRSIFNDLVDYIKKKKKERQIIIVTHNANLVLGCDADEIIVANQEGSSSPNMQYKFEYRSGSIENNLPIFDSEGNVLDTILNKYGIQQHICDILEGGELAFEKRKNKYNI